MKFLIAAFVFILAIGISYKTVASEPEVCTSEKTENCTAPAAGHTQAPHDEQGEDHHAKLSQEMNSLFPEKQKNPAVSQRPTTVKLTSPKFLAAVTGSAAKLEWTAADGASDYHVQVATDPNFKWLVAEDKWVKNTSFDVQNLEAGKKYYWRVASIKNQNISMFTKSLFVSSAFSTK